MINSSQKRLFIALQIIDYPLKLLNIKSYDTLEIGQLDFTLSAKISLNFLTFGATTN